LLALGQKQRAMDWVNRALLIAPDNLNMRYNLGCALAAQVHQTDTALNVLGPFFERVKSMSHLKHADVDPDLDPIRNDPRFREMVADAKSRVEREAEPGQARVTPIVAAS
jgi:adenylate cyclase